MSCAKCGNPLRADAAFCDRCGAATVVQPPPRYRVATVMVVAVAVFVVLAVAGIKGLLGSSGGSTPSAGASASSAPSGGTGSTAPASPTGGTASTTPSTALTPRPSVSVPRGGRICPAADGSTSLVAISGTPRTSCEFAYAVRSAYAQAATDGGDATVRAVSPVTRETYSMRCTGAQPVTCRGGNGAVVYLAP